MGARIRGHVWTATALGPPEGWPRGLQTAVQIMLNSRFAMWMAWGPELTFFCNDAYLPTTGLKGEWVLGARSDRVWAEIWPDIGPRIQNVLETGRATWDEALLLYLERSGFSEETYHTFSYSPLADDDGGTAGMLCVVAEVTERVIGERQLAMLRDLGSRLAAASTRADAMTALQTSLAAEPRDLPFALAYLREQASSHAELVASYGLTRDTESALRSVELRNGSGPWPLGRVLREGAQTVTAPEGMLSGFELRHWQSPPHRAHVVPLVGAEGGVPVGFLVAGLNPHRTFDTGYRGFIDLVAGQLAAGIARADEYERERARAEALTEIDRAKTAFFSNVSHEFRTPLTLLLGPLEDALANPGSLPPEQLDRVSVAHRNGLRLLRLVNGLLDFSRIEAGRVEAVFTATDLARYTTELASTFRSACERAGLEFLVDCTPLPAPVYVDADMWEKVVLNLLSNAFKFTLRGSIAVTLDAVSTDEVELAVRDTGTGIPAAELPRLFERFHRVEGAKGRSFEGSGIGLALVHDLVRLHGGNIVVESEEGQGSTFRVRLPRGMAHLPDGQRETTPSETRMSRRAQAFIDEVTGWIPAARSPSADEQTVGEIERTGLAPASSGAPRRAGRVLLADDNADLRDYVRRLLAGRGYVVEAVVDGDAALEAARARRPDLLLTDIMMPGLDGVGLLSAIRSDPGLADLPVIMLSARAGEEAQVEGLGAGADDYLAKPFSARELLARVAANLDVARTRREAADAVRASEARLRGVLEGMAEGFALLDPTFRIVEVNAEGLRLEAVPRESLVGLTHWEAYPGSESGALGQLYKQAMLQRVPVSLEHRHTWKDGRTSWLDMRAYPTEDGGLAIFYRDVTERRLAEDSLRELNETLERRVLETVAEREEALARLNEAQKLETLGQLTGGVAHDFNNLLTPIMGTLEMLAKRHPDERSQRLISGGLQSAHRAKSLVQRLLAFARRQTLAPQPVDLPTLVNGMRDLIDRSIGPTVRVVLEIPDSLPPALVDPNQLELALLNLAVNSRDAMEGGGTLTVTACIEDVAPSSGRALSAGRYVRLDVADTGTGMDEETLARAVEPFYSTKEMGKGTGLGLSMVHGLALQSGGAFELASVVGAWTTATLWLPITDGSPSRTAELRPETPAAPRAATLLLVDDEPLVRTSMAGLLEELGYQVISVCSGAEALEVVRTGLKPDLLVTDHKMPGMTGTELAARLRATIPGLPVLLVTGYASPGADELLGLEVLTKPFGFADLAARLAALLQAAPASGEVRPSTQGNRS